MKKDFLFQNLIEALKDRIPERGKLADVLTELLDIEKEAVYRRLRGSVPFSFQEIHQIAGHFGFSLDSIAENTSTVTKQMTIIMVEYLHPKENDYKRLEDFNEGTLRLKDDPDSESGAIGSLLPTSLYYSYDYICKFFLYRWTHQFGNPLEIKSYAQTNATERLMQICREYVACVQATSKSVYVLDRRVIEYFVNDIRFFYDVRLISREDVLCLKDDLRRLINDLERYATNGCFDTGNKVEIFLTNVYLDANYYYADSTMFNKFTMMRSFAFSDSYSFDEEVFQNMKNWLTFLKRTSTFISEGNATERIRFFEQQRELVESM
jgi:hypothetical protein